VAVPGWVGRLAWPMVDEEGGMHERLMQSGPIEGFLLHTDARVSTDE
jgi:hypothetical protein